MSAPATPILSLVEASTRLPSPPREPTLSSQRAYIGIDGENFRYIVKGLGYENIRPDDFVKCIAEHLGIPAKKGPITGVLVSPRNIHYGKGKAIEQSTGLKLVEVNDFRKEADDGVLRSELNQANHIDIIVLVSNDLGAYLKVILNHKKNKKRVIVAGSKTSQCGWAKKNDFDLENNGIEFFELSNIVSQFADKIPEDPLKTPPLELVPAHPVPTLVPPPVIEQTPEVVTSLVPSPPSQPVRKGPPMSYIQIYINETNLETAPDALKVILEELSHIFHENLQITTGTITGRPEEETIHISFTIPTRMSRNLLPRIMEGLRTYSKKNSKVLPGVSILPNHV
jgi:hypothetical protein